ncbi:MAG TPA: PrsW family glutamic-type intramembrane protease [Candidatus Paceibacterota bacterium]
MIIGSNFLWAFVGGLLPAIFWLWFWLHEDKKHPEPKLRIILSFGFGMLAVLLVLPVERFFYNIFGNEIHIWTLLAWAAAEEVMKIVAAYFAAFRSRVADEPVDFLIYMVSTALGFSALENSLFLFNMIGEGFVTQGIISGNMRFLGATLLHTVTSATIGTFIALAFYKNKEVKKMSLAIGIMLAIALHTLFNFFIIEMGERVFFVFTGVWVAIILMILMFEKVKSVKPGSV